MDQRFPEANPAQLQADVCTVCFQPMENGRALPCGHVLHRRCLLSWLERAHTCPICREDVFGDNDPNNVNNNPNIPPGFNNGFGLGAPPQEHFRHPRDHFGDHAHEHPQMAHHSHNQYVPSLRSSSHQYEEAPTTRYVPPTSSAFTNPGLNANDTIAATLEQLSLVQDQLTGAQDQLNVLMSTLITYIERDGSQPATGTTATTSTSSTSTTTTTTPTLNVPRKTEEKEKEKVKEKEKELNPLSTSVDESSTSTSTSTLNLTRSQPDTAVEELRRARVLRFSSNSSTPSESRKSQQTSM